MKSEIVLLTALSFLGMATARAVTPEPLPSPYFVDEVHCEGINVVEVNQSWLLPDEDVEPVKRVVQRETCERVLNHFGIEKFMWLSPEDLERISTTMKQSGHFEQSEITIQKSELKNHVHVFLKVKPRSNYHFSVSNDLKYYAPQGGNSSRLSDRLQVEVTNRRMNPLANHKLGVIVEGTSADSALMNPPAGLLADDQSRLAQKTAYNADLYYKTNGAITPKFSYYLGVHLLADNVYRDSNGSKLGVTMNGELLYNMPHTILGGRTFFGVGYLYGTSLDYDGDPSILSMPGLTVGYNYGKEFANNLNFKASTYRSGTQYLFDYDFNLQARFSLGLSLVAGLKFRKSQGVRAPQDRFPYLSTNKSETFYGLAKVISRGETKQQIAVVVGTENLQVAEYSRVVNSEAESIGRSADFIGLKYKAAFPGWDLNLGANYYTSRNH